LIRLPDIAAHNSEETGMTTDATTAHAPWTFAPLTAQRWKDFETLFGGRGACGGCWCMWWRLMHAQYQDRKGTHNKQAMKTLVDAGARPGILAYHSSTPAGWCAVAPRDAYIRLTASRVLMPVDDRPVWSIVCFFIAKTYRRRGLTRALIDAAAAFAAEQGASIVEAYPVDPNGARKAEAFIYTGIASTFRDAGFVEVARRSDTRPIMRKTIMPR
jgi:GNAT superfamily N-acetyltransferase